MVVNLQVYGVKPDFLTCSLLGPRDLNWLFRMGGDEFVTMNIVQSLLEVQANAPKASFRVLFDEQKEEIKTVRKDIVELQTSLSFSQVYLTPRLAAWTVLTTKYEVMHVI